MEKQKKSYGKTALIVLLLIVTIASLVLATYAWAKYSSVTEGNATAQVAKWDVDVAITPGTNKMEETYKHVLAQRLAPGTSGSFEIVIDPKDTEVNFHYEIVLEDLVVVTESGGNYTEDKSKPVPAHLHFYTKDSDHTEDNEIYIIDPVTGNPVDTTKKEQTESAKNYLEGDYILIGDNGQKKTPATTSNNDQIGNDGKIKKIIYWEWPYEDPNKNNGNITDNKKVTNENGINKLTEGQNGISDYDDQDTADGMNAYKVQVQFRVTTTQIDPPKKD